MFTGYQTLLNLNIVYLLKFITLTSFVDRMECLSTDTSWEWYRLSYVHRVFRNAVSRGQ